MIVAGSTNPLLMTSAGGYNLTRSLRFRQSASGHLTRTPSSETNRKTWTWSGWIKWSLLDVSNSYNAALFTGSNTGDGIMFWTNPNTLGVLNVYLGAANYYVNTTQVFRDPSAWYHIVVAIDTTQATSSNRIKLYVNGSQVTAFSATNYPTQNYDTNVNTTGTHYIGRQNSLSRYYDGYMTEVNFIDGQALTPSSFGETNSKTGVWQPKRYAGTYGTNGFYLPFTDNSALTTSSNVGLGKDFSGNGNYWTTNNISITSGVTYDSMTDVPTLTSATASNFATLNPLSKTSSTTISNANLSMTTSANNQASGGTIAVNSGKYYWEATVGTATSGELYWGIATIDFDEIRYAGGSYVLYVSNGQSYTNSSASYGASYAQGDVLGCAVDCDNGTVTFYKNGTSQGAITGVSMTTPWKPSLQAGGTTISTAWNFNFGQRPFAYTPPTGYVALNTYNLPTPTIGATASTQANKYMDATLYTGTGSSNAVVNAGGFQPDFVWIKGRSNAYPHFLYDAIRTAGKYLASNSTDAEVTTTQMTSFNSNGFTVNNDGGSVGTNNNGSTFVGWQWKGANTTVTNTAGSITSTVSANTTSGFSIVGWTGNGSNATVGHGLGVAPNMFIVKRRQTTDGWFVYNQNIGNTNYLRLNTTAASATFNFWQNTNPTSSVFSITSDVSVNASGETYIAYCFAEVAGFSKFGSYTGNGSTDGPFVFCGFRPRYIMVKRTTGASDWFIMDTARNTYNEATTALFADLSNADYTLTTGGFDILSNGFKLRVGSSFNPNTSGETFIYMAFAESPFKYSLAR